MEVSDQISTENLHQKSKSQNPNDLIMTSSSTSMNSSLSSPVDSGVQLLDSESEATSVMSASGTGCEIESILNLDIEISSRVKPNELNIINIDSSTQTNDSKIYTIPTNNLIEEEKETNEFKCQMDLFEKEFGIASIKEYFLSSNDSDYKNDDINTNYGTLSILPESNSGGHIKSNVHSPTKDKMQSSCNIRATLNKSFSDDVFLMDQSSQENLALAPQEI
ncbi:hypothetical protein WA026_003401 [Henosepilachna vigintioctopunctata]|uniref:Uncharacterized protein n=1 Tax=Henosepilachna vigintioctopunctata TaxID=420089 RepID=A0AAW1TM04_9CUCU